MKLSSFEILFEPPLPLAKGLRWDLKDIGDLTLRQQMNALGWTLKNQ
jgi:hypothetical protein